MKPSQLAGFFRNFIETITLKFYAILGPRIFSPRYFEYRYRRQSDPWRYEASPYERRKYEQTLGILTRGSYERALEVGCSIGVFTEQLAERGIAQQILGIDVAEAALERARKRLARFENVQLLRVDITQEPLEGSFDLIFCAEVLYYLGLKNLEPVAEKLTMALRVRGHLVLVNPWPLAHSLHPIFLKRVPLRLVKEHIEQETRRPYVIALFVKPSHREGLKSGKQAL